MKRSRDFIKQFQTGGEMNLRTKIGEGYYKVRLIYLKSVVHMTDMIIELNDIQNLLEFYAFDSLEGIPNLTTYITVYRRNNKIECFELKTLAIDFFKVTPKGSCLLEYDDIIKARPLSRPRILSENTLLPPILIAKLQ